MNEIQQKRWSLPDRLAVMLLMLGALLRMAGAWVGRCLVEPDPGVVALMARHMAELKEFPIFFYGQAYMGSLEPMASAWMVRLLGSNGFAVNLGPVIFAVMALVFLWRWARDAAGPWGGVAAVLTGLFGPLIYFYFQSLPRGGYMVALAVDALVLWGAARMAARLREGKPVGGLRYLALGLLAGVGMWSNMIIASALLTAALLLVHGMRWKIWRHLLGIVLGLVGFVAGFSPWIYYNVRNGWPSMEMSQIGGYDPVLRSMLNSWNRFLMLQDASQLAAGSLWLTVLALVVLGLAAWGGIVMLLQFRRASLNENYSRVAALVFCVVFAVVFVTSGFTRTRTGRYWIPLVPGLAVLSAVACAAPGWRVRRGMAWAGLAALTAAQGTLCLSAFRTLEKRAETGLMAYREMGEALDRARVDALMAPLQLFAMNFVLDERVAISNGKQKFYEPTLRRAELSDAPAYTADFFGIETFLRQRGAQWDSVEAGGRRILWNVKSPEISMREVEGNQTQGLCDQAGTDWGGVLLDRNVDTWWSPGGEQGGAEKSVLEWTFENPQDVDFLQLVFAHGFSDEGYDFPRCIRVEAKQAGEWRTLLADEPIVPLEWSGTRAYYPSGLGRMEYRLAALGVEALRIGLLDTQSRLRSLGWRLAELNAYVAQAEPLPKADAVALDALCERASTAYPEPVIFAPRWVSNKLHQRGCVRDCRLAGLSSRIFPDEPNMVRDGSLPADKPVLIVVDAAHAAATRDTLVAQDLSFEEAEVAPWVLFSLERTGRPLDGHVLPPALIWTGNCLLAGNTAVRAGFVLKLLRTQELSEEARKQLVMDLYRWRPSALSGLTAEDAERWGGDDVVQARQQFSVFPKKPCATVFANGFRLEGVEPVALTVRAGGELVLNLYWSAGEELEAGSEIVFIHIRDKRGNIVAQQDYRGSPVLWDTPNARPAQGECMQEVRRIPIPAGLEAGPLTVSVGLFQPDNGRRVKVLSTEAPEVRRNAVTWPGRIQVVE